MDFEEMRRIVDQESLEEKQRLLESGIEGYIEEGEETAKIAEYMQLMEYHRLRAGTMMHFPPPWWSPEE